METVLQQGNTNAPINIIATLWCFASFELALCVLLHSLAECVQMVVSQDMLKLHTAVGTHTYTHKEKYFLGIASCAGKVGLIHLYKFPSPNTALFLTVLQLERQNMGNG